MRSSRNRRTAQAIFATLALLAACGGESTNDFSDGSGAGEPASGGASSGAAGTSAGLGGTAGSVATGGTAGDAMGGYAGVTAGFGGYGGEGNGAFGGTAGDAGSAGTSGGSGGTTAGSGGTTAGSGGQGGGAGGVGGQVGGFAGVGGAPDSKCPVHTPTGACAPSGLSCRYDAATGCLCVTPTQYACGMVDPRCFTGPGGGANASPGAAPPGIAIPVASMTCDCLAGTWSCHIP